MLCQGVEAIRSETDAKKGEKISVMIFSNVAPLERAGNADIDSALQNVCILRLTRIINPARCQPGRLTSVIKRE